MDGTICDMVVIIN